jgi:beta-glucosidase
MTSDRSFPDGFLWGAATSAYQIEGAVSEAGRGPCIWDTFSHTPGRTLNSDSGDVACRHYERLGEDLDLIAGLGLGAYRFSVAWSRVQPDGKGGANQEGLDFYRRLVAGLRDRGILPVVTLYHFDLPQALEDSGGWPARDTAERFAEYTEIVAGALSDEVGLWITLNEPWCSAWLGYGMGVHAPGRSDPALAMAASHHLLLAHSRASEILHRVAEAPVGISLNFTPALPASDHELDVAAARTVDGSLNRLFLEPLFKGRYPEDMTQMLALFGMRLDFVKTGDLEVISRPVDFLGVNYYTTTVIASSGRLDEARLAGYVVPTEELPNPLSSMGVTMVRRSGLERTANDLEVDPSGLADLLVRLSDEYTRSPLYVTENGVAQHDYRGPDGAVHDSGRTRYLERHVQAARQALDRGVNLKGYFVWSLLDNYEWDLGYSKRFGLVWVDFPTGERVPKDSYHWYSRVTANNALPSGS